MEQINHSSTPAHTGGMTGDFYNTIHLVGMDLAKSKRQSTTQTTKILAFLQERFEEKFTSSEIRKHLIESGKISERTQETTIRARLTDLSKRDFVMKLSEMRDGYYGKPNHLWTLKTEQEQI
jgi:hypothetical protein